MGHLRRYSLGSLLVSLLALTLRGEPPTPTAELEARLVERHGGTIEVESEPGEGSTFTVVLPLRPVENRDLGDGTTRSEAQKR